MTQESDTRVIVGMSGGVDSSVAALLLSRQGYSTEGLFMKNWEDDDREGDCPALMDALDASEVCEILGIPLHTANFATEYWDSVFEEFLHEYAAGRTPNPDILCNREIKFRRFLDRSRELGARYMATGHYVRRDQHDGHWRLLKGLDQDKDQSYFLYTLGQEQLESSLFPVGALRKGEVRRLAQEAKLPVHNKKDSTGICFIGERDFREFLARYLPAQPGEMRDPDGRLLGEHQGLMFYTLGQRQGLGIGGTTESSGHPWYVVDKAMQDNILVVAQGHDHPLLFTDYLEASQLHWVSGSAPATETRLAAKTRYRQSDQPCRITMIGSERCELSFAKPQRAVTAGQSVVLYRDQECLGGGIIERAWRRSAPAA